MKPLLRIFPCPLSLLLLFLFALLIVPQNSQSGMFTSLGKSASQQAQSAEKQAVEQQPEKKDEDLPDEDSFSFTPDVPGPGVYFGLLLDNLSRASIGSGGRINKLVDALPQVYPDLKKVFLSL